VLYYPSIIGAVSTARKDVGYTEKVVAELDGRIMCACEAAGNRRQEDGTGVSSKTYGTAAGSWTVIYELYVTDRTYVSELRVTLAAEWSNSQQIMRGKQDNATKLAHTFQPVQYVQITVLMEVRPCNSADRQVRP